MYKLSYFKYLIIFNQPVIKKVNGNYYLRMQIMYSCKMCSVYHVDMIITLCISVVCNWQTTGSREFAAARGQVEKYQRNFW